MGGGRDVRKEKRSVERAHDEEAERDLEGRGDADEVVGEPAGSVACPRVSKQQ